LRSAGGFKIFNMVKFRVHESFFRQHHDFSPVLSSVLKLFQLTLTFFFIHGNSVEADGVVWKLLLVLSLIHLSMHNTVYPSKQRASSTVPTPGFTVALFILDQIPYTFGFSHDFCAGGAATAGWSFVHKISPTSAKF